MIVDDHDMVRKGLATFLKVKADLELVGEASNGQEALQVYEQARPDVILMDLVMPVMDGVAATRAIRERCPQIQVIALTSFKDKDLVQDALQAGAISYLLKDVSVDELADAIRAAHAGRPTLAPEAAQVLIQATRAARESPELGYDLTPREREVLQLVAEGYTNREIAEMLTLSIKTVKTHRLHLMQKLGLHDRGDLIKYAIQRGIITP